MTKQNREGTASSARPPTMLQLILFSLPSLPHAFIALPLTVVIPQYYAANTSVSLLQIASMTTASRLLDAFLDPMIGMLSDRTKSPLGRRKPWLIAAAVVCSISILFLFRPAPGATYLYYGLWSFLLYFGFTLFEIPRAAWSSELSRDYMQRSRINTYVGFANIGGSLIFWVMPLLLVGVTGTTAITGTSIGGTAWLYVALMPTSILLAAWLVPSGDVVKERLATFRDLLYSLRHNKPLWSFYTTYAVWGLGQGAYLSVVLIFLTDYMRIGALFPFIMIAFFAVQSISLPFWHRLIERYGKHRVWAVSMVLDVLTRPLILLMTPGDSTVPMLALMAVTAFLNGPANICPYAILGDVIDYDILKTRQNKAGNIFALNTLLLKATMAAGAGLAFSLLDFAHYRVGHSDNTASANMGLIFCYLVFPALFYFGAAAIAWFFPIDSTRHAIIRRRIERRAARAT